MKEGDTQDPRSCVDEPPVVFIGTGEQVFEEMIEEQGVIMVHGPQGGWHMLGSIRIENTSPIVEIDFEIEDLHSGVIVSSNHYRVGLLMEDDCSGYYPGMYGYLNVQDLIGDMGNTPPELLGGHLLEMRMQSNDCTESQNAEGLCIREERWGTASFLVTAELDPVDQEDTD